MKFSFIARFLTLFLFSMDSSECFEASIYVSVFKLSQLHYELILAVPNQLSSITFRCGIPCEPDHFYYYWSLFSFLPLSFSLVYSKVLIHFILSPLELSLLCLLPQQFVWLPLQLLSYWAKQKRSSSSSWTQANTIWISHRTIHLSSCDKRIIENHSNHE